MILDDSVPFAKQNEHCKYTYYYFPNVFKRPCKVSVINPQIIITWLQLLLTSCPLVIASDKKKSNLVVKLKDKTKNLDDFVLKCNI